MNHYKLATEFYKQKAKKHNASLCSIYLSMVCGFNTIDGSSFTFVDSYKIHYRKISQEKTTLLPDALEAVKEASKIARLGIVTTKTTQYSIPLLENFGLLKYFETIIGRQEVTNPKPHPEPILTALKNLNVKANLKCYIIGDTKLDLIAGNEAKISSVGVLCGYGYEDELKKYTHLIATNSLDAVKLINYNN